MQGKGWVVGLGGLVAAALLLRSEPPYRRPANPQKTPVSQPPRLVPATVAKSSDLPASAHSETPRRPQPSALAAVRAKLFEANDLRTQWKMLQALAAAEPPEPLTPSEEARVEQLVDEVCRAIENGELDDLDE